VGGDAPYGRAPHFTKFVDGASLAVLTSEFTSENFSSAYRNYYLETSKLKKQKINKKKSK